MEFFQSAEPENFKATYYQEAAGNTLHIEIKEKNTTASELNEVVKTFAKDNLLDELDSNTMQLVTEEMVVMILLQMLPAGYSMQYVIAHDRNKSTITLGMGYPGVSYNPFEMEENIFMVNIFREWITNIQFTNPTNTFNQLLLTIPVKRTGSEVDDLICAEAVSASPAPAAPAAAQPKPVAAQPKPAAPTAPAAAQPQPATPTAPAAAQPRPAATQYGFTKSIFDEDAGRFRRDAVPAGEVVHNARSGEVQILELLIREKGITVEQLYAQLDTYFATLDLQGKAILFDGKPSAAEGSIKSVCKIAVTSLLSWFGAERIHMECKLVYMPDDNEMQLHVRYPGAQFNPFIQNEEDRGIRVLSRQTSVRDFYSYKETQNKLLVLMEIVN